MMLALKILGMWTMVSIAAGLVICPIFARRLEICNPEEASSGDVTVAANSPLPGQRPSRTNSVGLTSKEVLP